MFHFLKKDSINTDPEKINTILTRGVEDIFVLDDLKKKLLSGKTLRVKLGFDPTGSHIHIGRAVVLRKLKAFQDLGHTVVFIVGDTTAQIGDPSDKLEKRPMLTREDVLKNVTDYKRQIGKIIDVSKAEFHYNSTWLSKLGFEEISRLAESFSVSQMSNRRNFKERLDKGEEVSLREFLYPLMQGYDSVAVKADVELGGFDQLFNLKAGRIIQRHFGMPEQDVLTVQMLLGTDGRKMSTSWGNVINIIDTPSDMYGKVMSIKDELVKDYFLLATDISLEEIDTIYTNITHPKEIKQRLAREIVSMYHSKADALEAEKNFTQTFSEKGIPQDVSVIETNTDTLLVDVLLTHHVVSSKTEFRRLIDEGAIFHLEEHKKITNVQDVAHTGTYRIGKKRFIQISQKPL